MREIKFRLRGLVTKKVLGYESIFDNCWAESGNGQDWQPIEKNNEAIREQFTGLLDKNGREIYEGDILKAKIPNGEERIYECVWYSHGFYFKEVGKNGIKHFSWKENEIIGNIYENPELPKGKDGV